MADTTTITAVFPSLCAAVEAVGFTEAADPFDFEHQPTTSRDQVYRIEAAFRGREGYLGPYALESWDVQVYLARRRHGSATDTYTRLLTDVSTVSVALAQAGDTNGTYHVSTDDADGDLMPPGDEQEYLVARLRAVIEFDRAL